MELARIYSESTVQLFIQIQKIRSMDINIKYCRYNCCIHFEIQSEIAQINTFLEKLPEQLGINFKF